ncbi:MAG: glycoside hydrolase family 75 protein, partial [Verrucomicrobiota bacterium]
MDLRSGIIAAVVLCIAIAACKQQNSTPQIPSGTPVPTPAPTVTATPVPSPTPVPTPTPIYVPSKRIETGKIFNGIELHSSVETEFGANATRERDDLESYTLDLRLKVRVPKPATELSQLDALNPFLSTDLPGLATMFPAAKASHFYDDFYRHKVASLQHNLPRLDLLLSRHNFFDCETVLELQHPDTRRRALLIQADMDIDMDGSDSDRVPMVDGTITNYQPMTSYKWPKKTAVPNQFLASREARLKQLEAEMATKGLTVERNLELRTLIPQVRYEVGQLKSQSFLVATTDSYVVMPTSMITQDGQPFTPRIGDYCVVLFKNTLYPAIIGDAGPRDKIGEASYRLGKEINSKATAYNRPVSDLKITYLVFPNSADKPFDAPDLEKIRTRCEQLLNEIGGYAGELHVWENLIKPPP